MRTKTVFELTVFGTPAPQGSKRSVPIKKGDKIVGSRVLEDNPRTKDWRKEVTQAAGRQWGNRPLIEGPIAARFTFYRARPRSHFGSGKNASVVKTSAPSHPTSKPDSLKLARAIEDSMSGIVFRDDSQIVTHMLRKVYGTPERVEIQLFIPEPSETP